MPKTPMDKERQNLIDFTNSITEQMETLEGILHKIGQSSQCEKIIGLGLKVASSLNGATGKPSEIEIVATAMYAEVGNQYKARVQEALRQLL